MDFEFDPAKGASNKQKHGIDFEEAQALWKDDSLFELEGSLDKEMRSMVIGRIAETYWIAVVTYRGGRTRLISVRRARELEIACYEG